MISQAQERLFSFASTRPPFPFLLPYLFLSLSSSFVLFLPYPTAVRDNRSRPCPACVAAVHHLSRVSHDTLVHIARPAASTRRASDAKTDYGAGAPATVLPEWVLLVASTGSSKPATSPTPQSVGADADFASKSLLEQNVREKEGETEANEARAIPSVREKEREPL